MEGFTLGGVEPTPDTDPFKRLGIPEDIASVVAFLASGDAARLIGQNVVIDGLPARRFSIVHCLSEQLYTTYRWPYRGF